MTFDELRAQWAQQIGAAKLEDMEAHLAQLTAPGAWRFDTLGRFSRPGVRASTGCRP